MKKVFSCAIACAAIISMCGLAGCSRDDGTVGDKSDHSSSAPQTLAPTGDDHRDDDIIPDDHTNTDDLMDGDRDDRDDRDDRMDDGIGNGMEDGGAGDENGRSGNGIMP